MRHKERERRASDRFEEVPLATYLLLAVTIAVFAAMYVAGKGNVQSVASAFGAKENDLIQAGQWWRFITPIFLHGSLLHLGVNALFLYWFGAQIEMLYGWRKYLIIYMVAGVAGNLFSFLLSPGPSLGASGALFGLVGAGIVFPLRFKSLVPARARAEILRQLLTVVVVNLGIGFLPGSHIDNWAHLGGLTGGGFAALFLLPDALAVYPPGRWSEWTVSLAAAALLLLTGGAALAQWRTATPSTEAQMQTFHPPGDNPWWSIDIPGNWRQVNNAGLWVSPLAAVVMVEDTPSNVQIVAQEAQQSLRLGALQTRLTLDGKPALRITFETPGDRQRIDIYLLDAYNRLLAIRMAAPRNAYRASRLDFERILRSMRVYHHPAISLPSGTFLPSRHANQSVGSRLASPRFGRQPVALGPA